MSVLDAKVNADLDGIAASWSKGEDEWAFVTAVYRRLGGLHWVDKLERWAMEAVEVDRLVIERKQSVIRDFPLHASWIGRLLRAQPHDSDRRRLPRHGQDRPLLLSGSQVLPTISASRRRSLGGALVGGYRGRTVREPYYRRLLQCGPGGELRGLPVLSESLQRRRGAGQTGHLPLAGCRAQEAAASSPGRTTSTRSGTRR